MSFDYQHELFPGGMPLRDGQELYHGPYAGSETYVIEINRDVVISLGSSGGYRMVELRKADLLYAPGVMGTTMFTPFNERDHFTFARNNERR